MTSINLSQSIQEKQALARGNFFDAGFFINLTIFVLVLAAYGGTVWYDGKLSDQLLNLKKEIAEKTVGMSGEDADRAKDLQTRLIAIDENLLNPSDPKEMLSILERHSLPTIRLTRVAQSQSTGALGIKGVTSNLRYLAQQMLVYKQLPNVLTVHTGGVSYNKEGLIEFEVRLDFAKPAAPTPTL